MHIAYLTLDPGIPVGSDKGAAVHVRSITRALRAVGHQVTIVAAAIEDRGTETEVKRIELESGARRVVRQIGALVRAEVPDYRIDRDLRSCLLGATSGGPLTALLATIGADIVLERLSLFGVAGLEAARAAGIPHTLEVNAPLATEARRYRGLVLGTLADALERRVMAGTDFVFPVSEQLVPHCLAAGARSSALRVVANGVDTALFGVDGKRQAERQRLGFGSDDCVIGMISSLRSWHGGRDLARAFVHLAPVAPHARLLFVGRGRDEETIRSILVEAELSDRACFLGAVAHEQIPAILEAVDIAVAPYRQANGFYFSPLKIYEYMAMERAVVAPAIGQIEDVIVDGKTGRLYEPGKVDALTRVLAEVAADPNERARIGRQARRIVEDRFTWMRAAHQIEVALMEVEETSRRFRPAPGASAPGEATATPVTAARPFAPSSQSQTTGLSGTAVAN